MSLFKTVLILFLMAGPIACLPLFLALLKDFSPSRQRQILVREGFISLLIALFFQYFGEYFLNLLHIQQHTMYLCGGVIVTLVAITMVFPKLEEQAQEEVKQQQEPFIVPIATPLLSGAGVLTMIMIYASEAARIGESQLKLSFAIILAWIAILLVLLVGPFLQKILKERGMIALEQLMGMLLLMLGVNLLVKGTSLMIGIL